MCFDTRTRLVVRCTTSRTTRVCVCVYTYIFYAYNNRKIKRANIPVTRNNCERTSFYLVFERREKTCWCGCGFFIVYVMDIITILYIMRLYARRAFNVCQLNFGYEKNTHILRYKSIRWAFLCAVCYATYGEWSINTFIYRFHVRDL